MQSEFRTFGHKRCFSKQPLGSLHSLDFFYRLACTSEIVYIRLMLEKVKTALFGNQVEEKLGPSPEGEATSSFDQISSVRMPSQSQMEKSRVAPGFYRPIPEETLVEWDAPARPFKKRKRQFFSTVLIISLLVSLILFFAGQTLSVAVVISVVFLVYVTAVIPPQDLHYKLTNYGIYVEKEAFSWVSMGRFWFDKKADQQVLEIELYRFPWRLTMVLLDGRTPRKVDLERVLSEVLIKEKPELTSYEKVAEWFKEKIPLE